MGRHGERQGRLDVNGPAEEIVDKFMLITRTYSELSRDYKAMRLQAHDKVKNIMTWEDEE